MKNPAVYDQGKYHANPMDTLRMPKPNLQSQAEVEALVTMLLGSTDPTLPPEYMYRPAGPPPLHSRRLVDRHEI